MGNSAKRDARRLERAEMARKVLELRKAGAGFEQIAKQLDLANKSVSWKLFASAIKEVIREPAETVLQLELTRLDAMLLGMWSKAKTGDPQAVDRVLRIMERRSFYLGLDQPKALKVEMAREIEGFLARLKGALPDDVYERVLAVAAGLDSPPTARPDPESETGDGPAERSGEA
jgi:hypothetical protein